MPERELILKSISHFIDDVLWMSSVRRKEIEYIHTMLEQGQRRGPPVEGVA